MNKNSKVLALKYRPQTFDDLIGQDVIAETIINSIKLNKSPNAYLFTGIRGVGKTTTARIVAKSLNCLNGIKNICKEISIKLHNTPTVIKKSYLNDLLFDLFMNKTSKCIDLLKKAKKLSKGETLIFLEKEIRK